MADWKAQVTYNYNPSYHAYAYGLVYQPGPEQNHSNLTGWGDNGVPDLTNFEAGTTQTYYSASTAGTREESPSHSPEPHVVNGHCYQGPGVVYLNPQSSRLLLTRPHRGVYEAAGNAVHRAGSDSASDSEAHTSPDSWSSGSSREGSLPQADPAAWADKDVDEEAAGRSPDAKNDVSSSLVEEPQTFSIAENKGTNNPTTLNVVLPSSPKKPSPVVNTPKGKVRAAFSESQMNALVQRFTVQRYLTPGEMKNLAELTGLTYKQVKTWFQNRRMKLRRHQKDTSWVSERYAINKDSSGQGAIFSNVASHMVPYEGDGRPQLREHYTHHMMESAFKNTPQNLAFYLAAMGSAPRSAGYHSWSSSSSQDAMSNKPQVSGWSMPPDDSRFEYSHSAFNSTTTNTVNNFEHNASFGVKEGEPAGSQTSLNAPMTHSTSQ